MAEKPRPTNPEDILAIGAVAKVIWQLDAPNRSDVAASFLDAQQAGTTRRYEQIATELWQRGWLDTTAILGA